jgi:hypothetical protein
LGLYRTEGLGSILAHGQGGGSTNDVT